MIPPPSFSLCPCLRPPNKTPFFHRTLVLLITFLAYASFHASRKPPSIVKSVLGPAVSQNNTNPDEDSASWQIGWPPFNGSHGTHRLGELDLAFLSSYSLGMYFSGHLGDRIDLRVFLAIGMFGSGIFTIAFGLGYWWDVHQFLYFFVVQIVCGLFQSIGWPCVVAVVGNWFGRDKRGLIMGIWNSHASFGNILGSIIAAWMLEFGWGWSFALPGLFLIFIGIVVYAFLVVSPEVAGFESPESWIEMKKVVSEKLEAENSSLLHSKDSDSLEDSALLRSKNMNSSDAIGFLAAWRLPGVVSFAFCLFFSKLVAYTFLYWLPFYIRHTAVAGEHLSHKSAGMLSTIFDVGGVTGGILAGHISDKIEARAVTSVLFLSFSIPALLLYHVYGSISMFINVGLMFLSGLLVNGPYSLITTAVATDLGTNSTSEGNSRALATITAIIDGTGSIGAAIGPLLAGYISARGWNGVFAMLIMSNFIAGLFLVRVVKSEIEEKTIQRKWFWLDRTVV
ncbi:hypothetical protein Nepgr_006434 [Nepenthes gracilis]|uniref:Major facilitator superfamily (MFS) profile domain-containing protein n=1 Tax=Nepenthes gracilis TaxID=150966 RepID=A0AAD3S4Z9_NEPGR|nr:hypothetical protein Nepgr_006434 [Nepenthes gracilis]